MLAVVVVIWAFAQTLTVKAPGSVSVGEQFKVTYTADTTVVGNFHTDKFPESLEVVSGPSSSTTHSMTTIGGKTKSSSFITYTYLLCANEQGMFEIPSGHITINGNSIRSQSLNIIVMGRKATSQNAPRQTTSPKYTRDANERTAAPAFSFEITTNTKSIYESESFVLTYKLNAFNIYDARIVGGLGKSDDYDLDTVSIDENWKDDKYNAGVNGHNYFLPCKSREWNYIVTPSKSGMLHVPSVKFDVAFEGFEVYKIDGRDEAPIGAFWSFGDHYAHYFDTVRVESSREVEAKSVAIEVKPLPQPIPKDFSGAIGSHCFLVYSTDVPGANVGDTVKVKIELRGITNINRIKEPIINFPKSFEIAGKNISESTIEYLVIPHNDGTYKLPMDDFVYFNIDEKAYKTVKAESYSVVYDSETGRYKTIKTDVATIIVEDRFGWAKWLGWFIGIIAVASGLFFGYYKRKKRNSNLFPSI